MRWFSHRRRTPPGSHEMGPSAAAARCLQRVHTIRTQPGGSGSAKCVFVPGNLDIDLDIRTWARFLCNAPNRQASSSYV